MTRYVGTHMQIYVSIYMKALQSETIHSLGIKKKKKACEKTIKKNKDTHETETARIYSQPRR